MSEAEKPEVLSTQSEAPHPNPPPPVGGGQGGGKPPREKPQRYTVGGSQQPKSLEQEQTYGFGKKIDAFDDEMEKQLQEAMGGLSDKDLLRRPRRAGPSRQAERGRAEEGQGLPHPRPGRVHRHARRPDAGRLADDAVPRRPAGNRHGGGRSHRGLRPRQRPAVAVAEGRGRAGELGQRGRRHDRRGPRHRGQQGRPERSTSTAFAASCRSARSTCTASRTPPQFVNQKLLCLVTEVDPSERNLVVSRRALLEKEREENREKLWHELDEGQVREGIVRSVREFGAFVDLGGVDGLIHVSEMSWERVQDAADGGAAGPEGQGGGAEDRPRTPQGRPRPEAADGQPVGRRSRRSTTPARW